MGLNMGIESSSYNVDSSPTQKLIGKVREKDIQRQQHSEKQSASKGILSINCDLSIVVPTRNEHDNIRPLVEALHHALYGLHIEIIFVDDSDDDTPEVIKDVARTMSSSLFHLQLEQRAIGEARAG